MKKLLIPALALAATSVALPAAAQSFSVSIGTTRAPAYAPAYAPGYGYDRNDRYERNWVPINQRFRQLDRRIDQGVRNGQLTRREAQSLRHEFNQLVRLEANYRRNGLNRWERQDLNRRFDALEARIRYERRDRDDRRGRGYR
ncbi:MAG: hypothetical protein Q8R97_01165 [Brevundimonas sp.]|uniref:hypothetical protein n=1 Tax=Brevundimonas sp. TaxID=1871086 RepID=UPI00274430AE|nr:hypothetical protein [Brevundimonas sp.]MDP3399710.1 hypothetical protein [Brevundimonas sp.]MDZ4109450.1 hypothetical protein [Brevundimonas sp.]